MRPVTLVPSMMSWMLFWVLELPLLLQLYWKVLVLAHLMIKTLVRSRSDVYVHACLIHNLFTCTYIVGGEGQSNPATPGDGSDQLDGDDSIIGDTTPGT